jgi:D-tyrosyl-tRNA(Tyr) deacylase
MRSVIQRVSQASVSINGTVHSQIKKGLLILLGVGQDDTHTDADKLLSKIPKMRIFNDAEGKMNLSAEDVEGEYLVVSQFTLYADTKKGNRPSFIRSAKPDLAIPLYEYFLSKLQDDTGAPVKSGVFGADMQVELTNSGPVTIIIDSRVDI